MNINQIESELIKTLEFANEIMDGVYISVSVPLEAASIKATTLLAFVHLEELKRKSLMRVIVDVNENIGDYE